MNNRDKLAEVELLILDVDGVLTEGHIMYNERGQEIKVFDVTDGLGIRLLMAAGIQVCIATGRSSRALYHRCRDLGINHIFDGLRRKDTILDKLTACTRVDPKHMAFMGDDLPDLPLMEKVGTRIAVKNAHQMIQLQADIVTETEGGRGAVREVCEAILKARDCWETALRGLYQ